MNILIAFVISFIGINIYFHIARRYQILDIPNERSSHSGSPIRGAGIIFPSIIFLASLRYSEYHFIGVGCIGLGILSLTDDIRGLSSKLRFLLQVLLTCTAFFHFLGHFEFYWILLGIFLSLAFLNAYNFMDGINGITAIYSLVISVTILYVDHLTNIFSSEILGWVIVAILVFAFYNVRRKAIAFSGDAGSIPLGLFFGILLIMTITQTDVSFLLLVSVYGIDSGLTIFFRLLKKENIFKAHRQHLYQRLANEKGLDHILVSGSYGLIQLFINLLVIGNWHLQIINPIALLISVLILLLTAYLYLGRKWLFIASNS